jgi:hypothetical protein
MFLGVDYYKCKRGDERFSIIFPPISTFFFSICMIKDQKHNFKIYFTMLLPYCVLTYSHALMNFDH